MSKQDLARDALAEDAAPAFHDPHYENMDPEFYEKNIPTAAGEKEFFDKHIISNIREAQAKNPEGKIRMINLGIGPGKELAETEIRNDPSIHITGVDLPEVTTKLKTRENIGKDPELLKLLEQDVAVPLPEEEIGTHDFGMLNSALIFKPEQMLATLYSALKPGAKAIATVTFADKYKSKVFLDSGGKMFDHAIQLNGETINFKALDWSEHKSEQKRNIGTMLYPATEADAIKLFNLSGFEIIPVEVYSEKTGENEMSSHSKYRMNAKNKKDPTKTSGVSVFIIQKPMAVSTETPREFAES